MVRKIRFRRIDELNREAHYHLTSADVCLYLYEKTSRRDYSFSPANQLIANIKKHPTNSSRAELRYKRHGIIQCSEELRLSLDPKWLEQAVLVPVPPSKTADDPNYDDRMEQICRGIGTGTDVRNLVKQQVSMVPSHERGEGDRISVDELLAAYEIDETLVSPAKRYIGIVDDVLTARTHYRAMHEVLSERFAAAEITGIFIARRIFPDDGPDLDAFDME